MKPYLITVLIFVLFFGLDFSIKGNQLEPNMEEICDNGIDDDIDGLIDLNDEDCDCVIVELDSYFPNPSFEDRSCCPDENSQLYCADSWIQASGATTDYIHTCGWTGWREFPVTYPFPDGEAIVGFRDGVILEEGESNYEWKEYSGACLLRTIEPNINHKIEFSLGFVDPERSPRLNLTIYGHEDCSGLPFGTGEFSIGCPLGSPGWYAIDSQLVSMPGNNTWSKVRMEFTSDKPINAFALGPPCKRTIAKVSPYYFVDNILLNQAENFDYRIIPIGQPCSDAFRLTIKPLPSHTCQWYKDGIALVGETGTQLLVSYGEGLYQVVYTSGGQCVVNSGYIFERPKRETFLSRILCGDETIDYLGQTIVDTGQYDFTLVANNGCDSVIHLDVNNYIETSDTIYVVMFEGETFEVDGFKFRDKGVFDYQILNDFGCDSTVIVDVDYFEIFFPNIFSPNGDGINDIFTLAISSEEIIDFSISIYDRWGNIIHTGTLWDGRSEQGEINPGVYIYRCEITLRSGFTKSYFGDITLLR